MIRQTMRLTILQKYVWNSMISTLVVSLAIFTFVLCVGNILKDILVLLVNETFDLTAMLSLILLAMPYALSFGLPLAMLATTLLVLGRFSADSELNAARACGISLYRFVLPILSLGVLVSFISIYINSDIAPNCRHLIRKFIAEVGLAQPSVLLEEGRLISDIPGYRIFIERKDAAKNEVQEIYLWILNDKGQPTQAIRAKRGVISADLERQKLFIQLFEVRMDTRDPDHPRDPGKIRTGVYAKRYPLDIDLKYLIGDKAEGRDLKQTTSWNLLVEAEELKAEGIHPTPLLVEVQKRLSMGVACFAFTLVGIPLSIKAHRRETTVGILIAFVLAVAYYLLLIVAEGFKKDPHLLPELIIWTPNLIFEAVGIYLLWRESKI
jgi:lipopolysaccharide export system permease protein